MYPLNIAWENVATPFKTGFIASLMMQLCGETFAIMDMVSWTLTNSEPILRPTDNGLRIILVNGTK
jgi:hypothetical protein